VKAVIARSFERIHRSNLVGMGVLPLPVHGRRLGAVLGLKGDETIDVLGLDENPARSRSSSSASPTRPAASPKCLVKSRIDTPRSTPPDLGR